MKSITRVELSVRWPVTYYADTGCALPQCLEGIQKEIFYLMQYDFNFAYELIENNDPVGFEWSNGSWNGVIGNSIYHMKIEL